MSGEVKQTPQALQYAMILELSRHIERSNLISQQILEEQKATRELLEALFTSTPGGAAEVPAPNVTPHTPVAATPAPTSSTSGLTGELEGALEEMIAEEMGVTVDALRTGNIDKSLMKNFVKGAVAKHKAEAAASKPPT